MRGQGLMEQQQALKEKILFKAVLRLETGLHIGATSDFAPIGAVDSPFVRDPLTKEPVIPGSSLKGKIRTLLARSRAKGYVLNEISEDGEPIRRLFGAAAAGNAGGRPARLQFFDLRLTDASREELSGMELDTYIGEIKSENAIDRITAGANPRFIERVPAGAEFAFRLIYNVEDERELAEDMEALSEGIRLLVFDYLGGHGSRGYGRVSLSGFTAESCALHAGAVTEEQLGAFAAELEKSGAAL